MVVSSVWEILATILVFMELTLQFIKVRWLGLDDEATILVFMELTLQLDEIENIVKGDTCYNPCFYGINFAINIKKI